MLGCGSGRLVHLHRPWFTGVTYVQTVWCERLLIVRRVGSSPGRARKAATVNHKRARKVGCLKILAFNLICQHKLEEKETSASVNPNVRQFKNEILTCGCKRIIILYLIIYIYIYRESKL
jgi:hypothetical protein